MTLRETALAAHQRHLEQQERTEQTREAGQREVRQKSLVDVLKELFDVTVDPESIQVQQFGFEDDVCYVIDVEDLRFGIGHSYMRNLFLVQTCEKERCGEPMRFDLANEREAQIELGALLEKPAQHHGECPHEIEAREQRESQLREAGDRLGALHRCGSRLRCWSKLWHQAPPPPWSPG